MPRPRETKQKHLSSGTIYIILLLFALTFHLTSLVETGASSTPKNLVNLSAPDDTGTNNVSNLINASSSQFQNEYQYNRQALSKSTSPDRHKSTTSPSNGEIGATSSISFEHLENDSKGPSAPDYSDTRIMPPHCEGRTLLNSSRGFITDGPRFYQTNSQCIWLIDSGSNNSTIRLQIHQFETEWNYDFLYIFDGDSVYSPLIATLSGDLRDFGIGLKEANYEDSYSLMADDNSENSETANQQKNSRNNLNNTTSIERTDSKSVTRHQADSYKQVIELKTYSGKAFIYFHSDTALRMPGFYITYSIDSCPLDCSNRGECNHRTFTCRCDQGFYGDGCQHILCPNNCTSPIHGLCDKQSSCICNHDFTGPDCSERIDQHHWRILNESEKNNPARAYHQAAIIDDIMWIFGGKSRALSNTNTGIYKHKKTSMILSYDLRAQKWSHSEDEFVGETGMDHLAELSGHSVAVSGSKAFIYGGMALNNTVLNTLSVFDIKTKSLQVIASKGDQALGGLGIPLPVSGHSANIVDGIMYVFWGYNPLYGYLNFAQKFNIANNSWSIIEQRGSSANGFIGHTSVFDPVSRLVFIYGGPNTAKSDRLYSFDPQTEVWTFLPPGPASRVYHSSIVMNGLLTILGGQSYTHDQWSQSYQPSYLVFDLACASQAYNNRSVTQSSCGRKCWTVIDDDRPGVMKRQGQSVLVRGESPNQELLAYGGFNGILMSDLRSLKLPACSIYTSDLECAKPRLGMRCSWNTIESACEPFDSNSFGQASASSSSDQRDCPKHEVKRLETACAGRSTCTDCLHTTIGCVWCTFWSVCVYNKCESQLDQNISKPELCNRNFEMVQESSVTNVTTLTKVGQSVIGRMDEELDCKVDNCYLCELRPHCSWQNDACVYIRQNNSNSMEVLQPSVSQSSQTVDNADGISNRAAQPNNSTLFGNLERIYDGIQTATWHYCDSPCFTRRTCYDCTTTKCIWCSTTEQCIDSAAYFAYNPSGQCMHYVAHMFKCPVSQCSSIKSCDKCLTNPKCGWLNDLSSTGKGRCIEGTIGGPALLYSSSNDTLELLNATTNTPFVADGNMLARPNISLTSWFYTRCPTCQCNGHSDCRSNSSVCEQPCQDFTEGLHCERCMPGFYGDPTNGGVCEPCQCNKRAKSCNRENGKCYCSTKGVIGHDCSKCDEKNYYVGDIGDLTSIGNGTCYYNLTTDYQYTFNMSKQEDYFYNKINFINVPIRKDSDADFTIACSRFALVDISAGTNFKNRRSYTTDEMCGSFRTRFAHDNRFNIANYSFFVHVHGFQTPFILQISFSQHRTLYLPQFFFTFSSSFIFFFALSGLLWKLKHEYDLYVRRQRQFIEMEQMASRPFSTILLEMFRPQQAAKRLVPDEQPDKEKATCAAADQQDTVALTGAEVEPTPISFEPCFSSHVGVLSMFVQLPGRPNLAIGSALVSLNDDNMVGSSEHMNKANQSSKEHISVKNL